MKQDVEAIVGQYFEPAAGRRTFGAAYDSYAALRSVRFRDGNVQVFYLGPEKGVIIGQPLDNFEGKKDTGVIIKVAELNTNGAFGRRVDNVTGVLRGVGVEQPNVCLYLVPKSLTTH